MKFAEGQARVGDWVVAVGNPFGLGGTVTAGIVSADGRNIGAGPYDDFIQIDAAVNRGNSGGPAFNLKGEVIGVNTAIFSPSGGNVGIAFAIPASTAEQIINDLTRRRQGRSRLARRPDPGHQPRHRRRPAAGRRQGLAGDRGAADGSPAAAAGLKSGDAILAVNGKKVDDPRELATKIAGMAPGDEGQGLHAGVRARPRTSTSSSARFPVTSRSLRWNRRKPRRETSPLADFGLVVGQRR